MGNASSFSASMHRVFNSIIRYCIDKKNAMDITLIKSGKVLKSSVTGLLKFQGVPIPWTLHPAMTVDVYDDGDKYRIQKNDRFIPWEHSQYQTFIGYINK